MSTVYNTNVPAIDWTSTGLVLPTEAAILAGVQQDYNAAFGGNLNPSLTSPQGQLCTATTASINDANTTFAMFVNQIDPDNNSGFMQDAIGRIYFMERNPGTSTVVQCLCIGLAGVQITVGALAQDTSGNIYECTQAGTIPVGGSITLPFANVTQGPIACPDNTLTKIYQAIPGWDSINNPGPNSAVLGSDVETPAAFEYRRQQSVAANAHGSPPSIYGAVAGVANVVDVFVVDNPEGTAVNYGSTNFSLPAHSVYVGVVGGLATAVAQAIWTKKDLGCNYAGTNTSEVVADPSYPASYAPQYTVKWQTPTNTPVYFTVTLAGSASLPANITALVQAAIIATFTGQTQGIPRAGMAQLLLASNYYPQVIAIGTYVSILSIQVGTGFTGTGTVTSGSTTLTVNTLTGGDTIGVGSVVSMSDVPSGTTIVSQLSGTAGGTGTYLMSAEATGNVGPVAITGAPGNAIQFGIDQEPTIQASNITVNVVG